MSTRISRFYTPSDLAPNTDISINDDRAHYIRNVLRLKAGDSLIVFDGKGGEYTGTVASISKKAVSVQLTDHNPINRAQPFGLTLGLCVLKREAMDLTLQKATELGVSTVQPIISDRVTVSQKQIQSRLAHWQAVVISACEQCGLNLIPDVEVPTSLSAWCESATGNRLIADPNAEHSVLQNLPAQQTSILIGPEGGFSATEVAVATASGFSGIYLGERILRAETAAIGLLALVNQQLLESN